MVMVMVMMMMLMTVMMMMMMMMLLLLMMMMTMLGQHSSDPRIRRCGWARIVNSQNGHMGYSPVAYHGEYGTMDGRQIVPRAEMPAVIRALMAIKQYGS
eukprot:502487-Karenia_brevis.AAC.1